MFKKYLKNSSFLVLQSIVNKLIGIITTPLISRSLSTSDFGTYSLIINTAQSTFQFFKLGIDAALHVNFAQADNEQNKDVKSNLFGSGIILTCIAALLAASTLLIFSNDIAIKLFNRPELIKWMQIAAILVIVQFLYQLFYSVLVGLHQFKRFATINIITSLTNLFLLLLFYNQKKIIFFIIILLVINTLSMFLILISVMRKIKNDGLKIKFNNIKQNVGVILKIGLPFHLAGLLPIPIGYYLEAKVTQIAGIEALGFFRIGAAINSILVFIPSSIAAATISTFSELKSANSNDETKFITYNILNLKIIWSFAILGCLTLLLIQPYLIKLFFGVRYLAAIPISELMLLNAIPSMVLSSLGYMYLSEKKTLMLFAQNTSNAIIFFIATLTLLPVFGINGYLYAGIISNTLVLTIFLVSLKIRVNRLTFQFRPLFMLICLTVLVMTLLIFDIQINKLFIIISLLPILMIIILTKIFTIDERNKLVKMVKEQISKFRLKNNSKF